MKSDGLIITAGTLEFSDRGLASKDIMAIKSSDEWLQSSSELPGKIIPYLILFLLQSLITIF